MKNSILIMGGIALLTWLSCSPTNDGPSDGSKFKVIAPVVRDTIHTNRYVAEIKAVQNVDVRARIGGFIQTVPVDEGQTVHKGQVLFTMDDQQLQQDLNRATAATKSAEAELRSAEIELEGSQKLLDRDFISLSEFKLAASKVEALRAKLEEVQTDLAQASLNLSFAQIRAPFDGVINRIPYRTGSLVEEGSLLTSISDLGEMFAYFNISEVDYLNLKDNNSKEVRLLLANGKAYPHSGIIETTESEFDPNTGTLAFRARFPNPDKLLKHGGSGKIEVGNKIQNALLIPQKATFDSQEHLCVFVVGEDQIARVRKIDPLLRLPQLFVVGSGLSAEERILYEGIQRVREGDKIETEIITFSQLFGPVQ